MLELARLVKELTDSPLGDRVRAPTPGLPRKQRGPDVTLARELLGWEPRVPVREGFLGP